MHSNVDDVPSFGGLIAIGLGVKKWTTTAALEKFKDLCKEAFAPRELNNVPLFGALTSLYHGSLYKTQPFAKALKRYFSDQPFFGGASHQSVHNTSTKVAITATTVPDKQPVLFANYNRPDPQGQSELSYSWDGFSKAPVLSLILYRIAVPIHTLRCTSEGDQDMGSVSAVAPRVLVRPRGKRTDCNRARATAATSPFFKPVRKEETGNEYADAGYKHACPVWVAHHEAKSIWRDPLTQSAPDIMLSLGTGRNLGEYEDGTSTTRGHSARSFTDTSISSPTPSSAIVKQGRGGAGNYKRQNPSRSLSSDLSAQASAESGYIVRNPNAPLLVTFNNPQSGAQRLTNTASRGDRVWNKFRASHAVEERDRHRYVRICPEFLSKLPKFDEVQRMDELEQETERLLRQNTEEVTEVAHRLVASSFFFEKEAGSVKKTAYGFQCAGKYFIDRHRRINHQARSMTGVAGHAVDQNVQARFTAASARARSS